jgi:hypothetical protein
MTNSTTYHTDIKVLTHYHGLFATSLLARGDDMFEETRPDSIELTNRTQIPEVESITTFMPDSLRDNLLGLRTSNLQEQIHSRLWFLANKPDRWRGAGSKRLNSESLRNFLRCWRKIAADAAEPFVTLAPNGNVYAEWHASWRRHLDMEFSSDGKVYFGLCHNGDTVEGKDDLEEVLNAMLARRKNPFRWTNK